MANSITRQHVAGGAVGAALGAVLAIAVPFIGAKEGLDLHPYYDSVHVKTVCYGATAVDGVDLTRDYTKQECADMLARDLPKYDLQVQKCLTKEAYDALTPSRHAAILSFTYNLGQGTLCKSSVARDLNAGRVRQACDDFLLYDMAKGRRLQGLANRRKEERELCLK